jgi:hypothetical protein
MRCVPERDEITPEDVEKCGKGEGKADELDNRGGKGHWG